VIQPPDLAAHRWFRAKQRTIASVIERDRADIDADHALRIVEVAYADGGSAERYLLTDPDDGRGTWSALARAITDGAQLRGTHGHFACQSTGAVPLDGALDERPMGVEQSNTSVVIGERLVLKVYRLLEAGENPDLEVGAFLTDAGFADTPAVAGSITWHPNDGEPATAAMLQGYVPSTGDGWAAMLAALAEYAERAARLAGEIGTLTARLHAALASRPDTPGFPARVATTAETAAWRASAEDQLAQAVASVSGEAHDRLVAIAPAVRARFADAFGRATGDELVTRIHGDYHLGQLLARVDGGFSVIDFEGEPARPLEERRRPSSPLRDVAGMLRSFDYAASTAGRTAPMAAAFLAAYGAGGPLVEAFELEKACYEVRYEANNRPDWLGLPLAAVERLAKGR
jgi:trehalose synthase-fused probable maltokinase